MKKVILKILNPRYLFAKQSCSCILVFHFSLVFAFSQSPPKYWISFKDKKPSRYSLNKPEQFLSKKSLERRKKGSTYINYEDLPISQVYRDSISRFGLKFINASRWFNGALYSVADEKILKKISTLSFVKSIEKRSDAIEKTLKTSIKKRLPENFLNSETRDDISFYGMGYNQIAMIHGNFLHEKNFRGKGICIAIIDAGFTGYNETTVFDSLILQHRILGFRDFVDTQNVNHEKSNHGTIVLGTMAANEPEFYVGGAPDASFWLLRSEDADSEYPSEEDNWIAAIEFADSAGVDLANTSLGYTDFDNSIYNHSLSSLNGMTLRISKAAQMAAQRGMLLTISAGNSDREENPHIGAPADAYDVLTVGAVDDNGAIANFSSSGIEGRIKPDIVAQGTKIASLRPTGWVPNEANGTSFSAPIAGAAAACFLQAFPTTSIFQIISAIKKTANRNNFPDNQYGYGIPNFEAAFQYLQLQQPDFTAGIAFPSIMCNYLIIKPFFRSNATIKIECFSISGKIEFVVLKNEAEILLSSEIQQLHDGIHIFRCTSGTEKFVFKAIKSKSVYCE